MSRELRRNPSDIQEEPIATVEEYKDSIEEQEIRGAYGGIEQRAQACIEAGGGAFE